MKITREDTEASQVNLTIELEPKELEPFLSKGYLRVAQRTKVPGFRPGKAPRALIERLVGKEALLNESLDFLLPEVVQKAVQEQGLDILGQPDIELIKMDPLILKAVVPLVPGIELSDYREMRLEPEDPQPSKDAVDSAMDRIRYESSPWEPTDRAIQFGDLVSLDVDGRVDGRIVAEGSGIEYVPQQDNPQPLPGFGVHLEGLSEGESKEFVLSVPPDHPDQDLAGKDCRFSVHILGVKEKKLPLLNDEFAKGVGDGYETLDALRERVREDLEAEATREAKHRYQQRALDEVLRNTHLKIPQLLLRRETEHLLKEKEGSLKQGNIDMETYLQQIGKTADELHDELRPEAEARLSRLLIVRELAKQEKLEVEAGEIDTEIQSMGTGPTADALRKTFASIEGRNFLESTILRRKVLERLEQIARNDGDGTVENVDREGSKEGGISDDNSSN